MGRWMLAGLDSPPRTQSKLPAFESSISIPEERISTMKSNFARPSRIAVSITLLLLSVAPLGAFDWSLIKDPEDGQLDLSNWLLERGGGFLPIPIIITEPAVSGGLGVALTFFHKPKGEAVVPESDSDMANLPPSVSFGAGAYTGNDSWLAAGGHFGSWKQDRIRYTGAAGLASVNLDFYVGDTPFAYNIDGGFLFQDIQFRIKETPLFVGARYVLSDFEATLKGDDIPGVDPMGAAATDSGLGVLLHLDSRDNLFSPTRGQDGYLTLSASNEAIGGDFNYEKWEAKIFSYHPLAEKFILGVRLDAEGTTEGAPFYVLPFVDLRGVPIGRYQDEFAGVAELEGLWNIVGRWTLVGFGGAGHVDGDLVTSQRQTIWAGGIGFRYLMARRLGLKVGIDLAWSEDDFAFYIAMGTGWR